MEFILYRLWDLGLKVGHAARTVQECIRQAQGDLTIRTNLLESRYLWGEQPLYEQFRARYEKEILKGKGEAFLKDKLAERQGAAKAGRRFALCPRAQHQGGQGRVARSPDPALGRALHVPGARLRRSGRPGRDDRERGAGLMTKAFNFLWTLRCHLALSDRPRRGAPDFRPAIRDGAAPRATPITPARRASSG